MEKKMALRSRRQRKVNSKYMSDDFESIFTERGRQVGIVDVQVECSALVQ